MSYIKEDEGLDNDAAIEHDHGLMMVQRQIDLTVRGYYDFRDGKRATLPSITGDMTSWEIHDRKRGSSWSDPDYHYMVGYNGAKDGLELA